MKYLYCICENDIVIIKIIRETATKWYVGRYHYPKVNIPYDGYIRKNSKTYTDSFEKVKEKLKSLIENKIKILKNDLLDLSMCHDMILDTDSLENNTKILSCLIEKRFLIPR